MPHFETTTCYHCDAEGNGREHVPPKCLFPKGSNWPGLMTVPSCTARNNANSKSDEYLKFLLGASASNIPGDITTSTARSVIRLAKMGSGNLHRHGFRWDGEILVIDKEFPLDFELLSKCLEKVGPSSFSVDCNIHNHLR